MNETASSGPADVPSDAQCAVSAKADDSNCDRRRICQRCLQLPGCMIDFYGSCASEGYYGYNEGRDYHRAIERGLVLPPMTPEMALLQYYTFRARTASYCAADDTQCASCVQNQFWSADLGFVDSRFCVGAGGCVCVFNCEYSMNVECSDITIRPKATQTSTPIKSGSDESSGSDDATATPEITRWTTGAPLPAQSTSSEDVWKVAPGAILFFIALVYFICKQRRVGDDRRSEGSDYTESTPERVLVQTPVARTRPQIDTPRPVAPHQALAPLQTVPSEPVPFVPTRAYPTPSSAATAQTTDNEPPLLELYGWISHRQNLIDNERRRLNGADDFAPGDFVPSQRK